MQQPQKKSRDLVGLLSVLAVGTIFTVAAIVALCTGHIKERSGDFSMAKDPSSFWGWLAFYVSVAAFAFYVVFKRWRRHG